MNKIIFILEVILLVLGFIPMGISGALSGTVNSQDSHIFHNLSPPIKIAPFVHGSIPGAG